MVTTAATTTTTTGGGGTGTLVQSLFSVAGKNVLITGGSRGIGLMIARAFVASGANVLLTSRSESACREASEAISPTPQNYTNNNYNNRCHFVASNVSDRKGCEALAEHASELFDHKLDVLINNAGAAWGEPLDRTSGRANWGFDKVLDLVRVASRRVSSRLF